MAISGSAVGSTAGPGPEDRPLKVESFTAAGEHLVRIENAFYEAVFAPGQAMFPALYRYKPTGRDMLIRRDTLEQTFASGDGIQLCLPWVGDSLQRVPAKGLLRGADWQLDMLDIEGRRGFRGQTTVAYEDPVDGTPTRLHTTVTAIARADTPTLEMTTEIVNPGSEAARFMWVAHGRMAPGGAYEEGTYVHLPAERCWVSDFRWPTLTAAGTEPHQWTDWPIPGVPEFAPNTDPERARDFVYAFVPAPWMAFGHERTGEVILFRGGPLQGGPAGQETPYFCILRRAGDILPEMSLSRELDAAYWEQEGATVRLLPGERLAFTWSFAATHGLTRKQVESINEVHPEGVMLTTPGAPPERHVFRP